MNFKLFSFCTLIVSSISTPYAVGEDSKGAFSLSFENDAFAVNTDRHYTNGFEMSYVSDSYMPRWFDTAMSWLPFHELGDDARFSWSIGQKMYTPKDIEEEALIVSDRPYAGWAFVSLGLVTEKQFTKFRHVESVDIILGVVGPKSGAGSAQRSVHDYLGNTEPRGWDNQLHNEYTADLRYKKTWLIPIVNDNLDILPSAGFTLGSSQRIANIGFGLRVGDDINADYGPPFIRPSLSGTHYFRPNSGFFWYLFAAAQGTYVDYNVFLDGNRDGRSHAVEKEEWIAELQAGIVIGKGDWRIAITNVERSEEFVLQEERDRFGSISLSIRF